MTQTRTGRQVHLVARPVGEPKPSDFAVVEVEVGELDDGEVLVANRFISVDPYMRGRMNDIKSYTPPFALGEAMTGGAVGEVIESRSADVPVGSFVIHGDGWREFAVVAAAATQPVADTDVPLSANLGVLGMTGLTAYAGLLRHGAMVEGDAVFVSGAAGAVGSVVGQIAKAKGASRVIGSAGSDEKVAHLTDVLGFDAAFNYRSGPVEQQLAAAAPNGIDVYFDNVGGDHLQAAIALLNPHGRVALCGAISAYNNTAPTPGPSNLSLAIGKRLRLEGFIVSDDADMRPAFLSEASQWLASGALRNDETIIEGIERAPEAFIGLMSGANTGKMLVKM